MNRLTNLAFITIILLFSNSVLTSTTSDPVSVSVDFDQKIATSKTTPTFQIVINPLISQQSPIHDAVWDAVAKLNTSYGRLSFWYPYPHYGVAELERPSGLNQCSNVGEGEIVHLSCEAAGDGSGVISSIEFASYGNFEGTCGNYVMGNCNAKNATEIVENLCLNKPKCSIPATADVWGDPCNGTVKRLAVQVTWNPPLNNTYWNFTLMDQVVGDFIDAKPGKQIINIPTLPAWMYNLTGNNFHYKQNPNEVDWNAAPGTELLDKSCKETGEYYGRVAAWYMKGGFTDEYGVFHKSSHNYNFTHWEVLNEHDFEHDTDIETYTCIYDQSVLKIREMADPDHKVQFVGLSYGFVHQHFDNVSYFLNRSNHINKDIPLDWISYHHYADCKNRTDPNSYENFFSNHDDWFENVVLRVEKTKKELSPETKTTINELGIILPEENKLDSPDFPLIYWNAAAASWAYMFTRLASIGIDAVGMSQMVGFPYLPDVLGGLSPQYPSVAMLNWTDGSKTARWWTLKVLIEEFGPGSVLVNTTSSNSDHVFAQGLISNKAKRLLLINKKNSPIEVTNPRLTLAVCRVIDLSTGFGTPKILILKKDSIRLSEFAVAMCRIILPGAEGEYLDNQDIREQVNEPSVDVIEI